MVPNYLLFVYKICTFISFLMPTFLDELMLHRKENRRYLHHVLCFALFAVLVLPTVALADKQPRKTPFKIGEKLTYQLRWGIFPAGYATLEVLPNKNINGDEAYHFRLTARSNSFIDTFYKVRDSIESFTDTNLTQTILYKKSQHEGSTKREVVVEFDLQNLEAHYTNKGKKNDPVAILPGTIDPLSSFYYIRNSKLKPGVTVTRPITDGKKNVIGSAEVIKRQSVTIRGKRYKTYLVKPDLSGARGVFEKSDDSEIKLWVTTDDRHLLVKIESKVVVGSFIGVLIGAENID